MYMHVHWPLVNTVQVTANLTYSREYCASYIYARIIALATHASDTRALRVIQYVRACVRACVRVHTRVACN